MAQSLTWLTKKEILEKEFTLETFQIFINGLLFNSKNNELVIRRRETIEKLIKLLNHFKIKSFEFHYDQFKKMHISFDNFKKIELNKISKKDFVFFLYGLFLTNGYLIKEKKTSLHLEIKFSSLENAKNILNQLNKTLNFKLSKSQNRYTLYLKKFDHICDFLNLLELHNIYFLLETKNIENKKNSYQNRYINLEFYNINKNVKSFLKFKKYYNWLLNNKKENYFNKKQIEFFEFKIKNKHLTLTQLTNQFNEKYLLDLTKSSYNHYLLKLKKLYNQYN